MTLFGLDDHALRAIGGIVHDIDSEDENFGRNSTAGIARLLTGIGHTTPVDAQRLDRGAALFDALYASFAPGTSRGGPADTSTGRRSTRRQ
jgi:hypothetical protein